ncbi:glycosyltransferase family 2 protein [Mesorhizobium mediterraneum]|uniref:glycosyltransferase family 2 protein n=1 Tax=Mesorhizobium mediterraneum TaxID=43617 RepID=UPI0017867FDD|nr:glycosyltransferase family 2 protein [Mesorhizobium mediterraneum]
MKNRDLVIPVTVVIPVKNEESNIGRCLSKLQKFQKVVVVDSGSSDATKDIVAGYGVELVNFSWNGGYPKKRNWMLINYVFKTPWVLFLDADEFVSEEFCNEISRVVERTEIEGFWLNYTNYFLGQPLRFGVPQKKLALFRVGSAYYERIDEDRWSNLDMEVHEHPILTSRAGEIKSKIDHQDFRGIEKFIDKHQDYAKWEAKRYVSIDWSKGAGFLTGRQKFKYKNVTRWWFPLFYFAYSYFVRLGFLDGSAGFAYAFYKTWYFFMIRNLMAEDELKR